MEEEARTMFRRQLHFSLLFKDSIWIKVREHFPSNIRSEMASVIEFLGAIVTRVLFSVHAVFVIWLVLQLYAENQVYWSVCAGLCFLAIETLFTLIIRKGQEYRYVWPSCFFYLCSLVPCVWILHMNMMSRKVTGLATPTHVLTSGFIIDEGFVTKVAEIGLVLIIITGRWLLPRGAITRDQLSALLLEYVAIAADILELFGAFEEPQVEENYPVVLAILSVYSWSLLQFTFSFTAFVDDKEEEEEEEEDKNQNVRNIRKELMPAASRKYLRRLITEQQKEKAKKRKRRGVHSSRSESQVSLTEVKNKEAMNKMQLHGDFFGILAGIFMQDGPFLILRLYLIIALGVTGDLQIFFAGKNAVTLALLIYRLLSVQCLNKADERTPYQRFRAASIAVVGMKIFSSQIIKNKVNFYNARDIEKEIKGESSLGTTSPVRQLHFETPA